MRKLTVTIIAVTVVLLAMGPLAKADDGEVGVLLIKNNGSITGHIWVDGEYQGYVPPGQAKYTVKEGFVTGDSGFQPDGTLKQTYSHGGWATNGPITVKIMQTDEKGKVYSASVKISGDDTKKGYLWFGESEAGEEPASLVWEDATQIPNAAAPVTPHISKIRRLAAQTKGSKVAGKWTIKWAESADGKGLWEELTLLQDGTVAGESDVGKWSCKGSDLQIMLSSKRADLHQCYRLTVMGDGKSVKGYSYFPKSNDNTQYPASGHKLSQ